MRWKPIYVFTSALIRLFCIFSCNITFSECIRQSHGVDRRNINGLSLCTPTNVLFSTFACYIRPSKIGKSYNNLNKYKLGTSSSEVDGNEQSDISSGSDVERGNLIQGKRLKNYYRILNLDKYASGEDIKNQYENLIESLKPLENVDSNVIDMINEAYRILSDENTRRIYDELVAKKSLEKESGYNDSNIDQFYHDDGDYFPENLYNVLESDYDFTSDSDEMVLEMSTDDDYSDEDSNEMISLIPKLIKPNGTKLHTTLTIPFERAIMGGNETVTISRLENCKCLENLTTCKSCNGYGLDGKDKLGTGFVSSKECSECGGIGKSRAKKCDLCDNTGQVKVDNATIQVQVPRNVYDGARLLIRNQGNVYGTNGKAGDLVVTLRVKEHDHMYRMGKNIYSDVTVPYAAAILGTTIKLETCGGVVSLEIPPGTQHGDEIQVPNESIPMKHICRIEVALPKSVDKQERSLLEKIIQLK
ncbi:Chaperone protein DnaJ [Babesia microti strain RI]|uniref:Chaperone protein DnaJ n=1 Tax=Babesia microti (strain RI) TaxID=1133968 RepID=I7I8T9_BABMR|nr:Chaperone protein DnaJ [Babesia microti strain RI]CCF73668.1 Chaperone protein DnaJ [Babesia microti strain RI]|eukprot:XP_012648277.1 Chaperone protein DnaJ [Babesia microti strain RI]